MHVLDRSFTVTLLHPLLSAMLAMTAAALFQTVRPTAQERTIQIPPDEQPIQVDARRPGVLLLETSRFIRAVEARTDFSVSGDGLTAAVLDTGLRATHVDFAGRVPAQRNFTSDNGGNAQNAADGNGHGTNVAGIIAANKLHVGIAPRARIIPLKVLSNAGGGDFAAIGRALDWVIANQAQYQISVVNMSLGSRTNDSDDTAFGADELREKVRRLRSLRVAVVVAAGNDYFRHGAQGMAYPAIFRETLSVGAVYDANVGPMSYLSGAVANTTAPGRLTPFSQRLHSSVNAMTRTDVFAPGAPVTSTGIDDDRGESIQQGTSQAAPVTSGVILLMQQYHKAVTGALPTVDDLEEWLRVSAIAERDGDDEDDNVPNTGFDFPRVDALAALQAVHRGLSIDKLRAKGLIR